MEYIIINKTAIQKRIEDLRQVCNKELGYASDKIYFELEHLLYQSTSLIPEIEKGIKQGLSICLNEKDWAYGISGSVKQDIRDYISNLKLDI